MSKSKRVQNSDTINEGNFQLTHPLIHTLSECTAECVIWGQIGAALRRQARHRAKRVDKKQSIYNEQSTKRQMRRERRFEAAKAISQRPATEPALPRRRPDLFFAFN